MPRWLAAICSLAMDNWPIRDTEGKKWDMRNSMAVCRQKRNSPSSNIADKTDSITVLSLSKVCLPPLALTSLGLQEKSSDWIDGQSPSYQRKYNFIYLFVGWQNSPASIGTVLPSRLHQVRFHCPQVLRLKFEPIARLGLWMDSFHALTMTNQRIVLCKAHIVFYCSFGSKLSVYGRIFAK